MARIYDKIDYFWSYDGDFEVGRDGDIMDTSFDALRSINQEITSRVRSTKGDWRLQESLGASLDNFVGQRNSQSVGQAIKNAIINSLLYYNLINASDIQVKVAPLNATMIAAQLKLTYGATRANSASLPVTLSFLYDYSDNNIYPVINKLSSE